MEKMVRVFISSVGRLMDEERAWLLQNSWIEGFCPVAMEAFSSDNRNTSIDVVIDRLNHSDMVIIVMSFLYGSIIGNGLKCDSCPVAEQCKPAKNQRRCKRSYTHFEFLYAKQKGLPTCCIIAKDYDKESAFRKRLNKSFKMGTERKTTSEEFKRYKKQQEELISEARKAWCEFYTASRMDIEPAFRKVVKYARKEMDSFSGLVDPKEFLEHINKESNKGIGTNTAITGTCIPFLLENDVISTWLIVNDAYKGEKKRIMFPGGHAFNDEEQSPENVAKSKADQEAGLTVSTVDLYHNFDLLPDRQMIDIVNQGDTYSNQVCIFNPPHYTYWFTQDKDAKCYSEKGHKFHYDAVYVCEVLRIENRHKKERVKVNLLNMPMTKDQIKTSIEEGLKKANVLNDSFGEYIVTMLYEAHKDYVSFLSQNKEKEGQ